MILGDHHVCDGCGINVATRRVHIDGSSEELCSGCAVITIHEADLFGYDAESTPMRPDVR